MVKPDFHKKGDHVEWKKIFIFWECNNVMRALNQFSTFQKLNVFLYTVCHASVITVLDYSKTIVMFQLIILSVTYMWEDGQGCLSLNNSIVSVLQRNLCVQCHEHKASW